MRSYLDFEKPVAELEAKVEELRAMGETGIPVFAQDVPGATKVPLPQVLEGGQ